MEKKFDPFRDADAEAIDLARKLLRTARFGAIAVLDPQSGAPSVSRVALATAMDGTPLILISTLAAHTAGLVADPRCSLLVGEPGKGDPLAHPRMTIACMARKLDRDSAEGRIAARRYLNRNPKAELYAGFADFSWFALEVERAALNGGFGKAFRIKREDIMLPPQPCLKLEPAEQAALVELNNNHRAALASLVAKPSGNLIATGLDPDGIDLVMGGRTERVRFRAMVQDPRDLKPALSSLLDSDSQPNQ